ncbi:MAG: UV DNA damage repair endonuclease UvsE [Ignavibacteriales bacterium]
MKVNFGYVAMSVVLEDASPSRTVTVKNYSQMADKSPIVAMSKVRKTTKDNLVSTFRILKHNQGNGVQLYRFSSKMIPLATHPLLANWDYLQEFVGLFQEMGEYILANRMRVSFHPDHYTIINSPREELFKSALNDLTHQYLILKAMGVQQTAKMVIHIGGGYNNKEEAIKRFKKNWSLLPPELQKTIILENDDKTYSAEEVLDLCESIKTAMVLDIHHYACNKAGQNLNDLLPRIISTWKDSNRPPKLHISSPKSPGDMRSHHDYVNPDDLYPVLMILKEFNNEIDIMVEAKRKDEAMFELVKSLAYYPEIRKTGPATLEL